MAELGILLVGPDAAALRFDPGEALPVARVRAEAILPLDEDLPAMVGPVATTTFHGPDADRWRVLSDERVGANTELLWACAQVHGTGIAQIASSWDRVLVVAWMDEPGLIPAVRALTGLKRPITVLLGGGAEGPRAGIGRANQVVLADLLRTQAITMVVHNPQPEEVIEVVVDAARSPIVSAPTRARPVDLGPALDLPSTWCVPASPVDFHQLVHVPMGHAQGLGRLAVDVAIWQALGELIDGPPVDVAGVRFASADRAREKLPKGDLPRQLHARIRSTLAQVRFRGSTPLVERIDEAVGPVLDEIREIRRLVLEVERLRLQHLRAFTAVGIGYTVQNLEHRLDAVSDAYPVHLLDDLDDLLDGESDVTPDGRVRLTAWRQAFAGLACEVAPRALPGSTVARRLVQERYELFCAEYSTRLARVCHELVQRARDPEAPPSTVELRRLRDRAVRVRDLLVEARTRIAERIHAACEQAVLDDRFVRWAAPDAAQLRDLLAARIGSLPVGPLALRLLTEALSRRPLGMADDREFETHLAELAVAMHNVGAAVEEAPSYESVLLLILQGRDPPVLRQALARSAGAEVELHLERPVEPALMNWLTATGMLVVVAPRLQTCAIYWQRAESLTPPMLELQRNAFTEHRLADLVLPPPDGDTVASMVAAVRAAVCLLVGLVVGELSVERREGLGVHRLKARGLELPEHVLLPHGALHWLAHDTEAGSRLRSRIERSLATLASRADAVETVRKLVELSTLGPSPTLAAQLGLYGARFEHLEAPIQALLRDHAQRAVAALVDVLHSDVLRELVRMPHRRALLDVHQLGPSGG